MSDVDVAEIEKNIKASLDNAPEQGDEPPKEDDVLTDGEEGKVNIDDLLDNEDFAPISLEGKISDDEAIEKATERGWREDGKDKFGHKISAIEFLERAPLFHKMDLMRGDIKKQQQKIDELVVNSKKIAEGSIKEKERLGKELKTAREALLSTELLDKDDIKELNKIDSQIEANNEDIATAPPEENTAHKEFLEAKEVFEERNKDWYGKDRAMTALADSLSKDYVTAHHEKHGILPDPADLFRYVMDEIKDDLPDAPAKRQTRVNGRSNRTVASKPVAKQTLADLPEDQQAIAREVIASIPDMTEESYLKTYNS